MPEDADSCLVGNLPTATSIVGKPNDGGLPRLGEGP